MFAFVVSLVIPIADPTELAIPARMRPSCVRITESASGRSGSGVVVGQRDGAIYILTAAHVIAKAKEIRVVPFPARDDPKPGTTLTEVIVLVESASTDIALIRAPDRGITLTPVVFAPRADGEATFTGWTFGCDAVGFPDARTEKVAGKRLLKRANGDTVFAWETNKRPEQGRSGGALLDDQGRLQGVCLGTQNDKGYYCHQDEIRALLKSNGYDWIWNNSGKPR